MALPYPAAYASEGIACDATDTAARVEPPACWRTALAEIDLIEQQLHTAVENSPLRAEPDYDHVNAFLIDSYRESWGWK